MTALNLRNRIASLEKITLASNVESPKTECLVKTCSCQKAIELYGIMEKYLLCPRKDDCGRKHVDTEVNDKCLMCRENIQSPCVLCSAQSAVVSKHDPKLETSKKSPTARLNSNTKQDCLVVQGECGHIVHAHCLSGWRKNSAQCAACSKEWVFQSSSGIKILIDGRQIDIRLDRNATVRDVKHFLQSECKMDSAETYFLVHRGNFLWDNKTMAECNIVHGSILTICGSMCTSVQLASSAIIIQCNSEKCYTTQFISRDLVKKN